MRKIILHTSLNVENFNTIIKLVEKKENNEIIIIHEEEIENQPRSKYTPEQQEKINRCNNILEKKGLDPLNDDEIEFMLDPTGINQRLDNIEKQMSDAESLQKMAGFKVEKKIISLD